MLTEKSTTPFIGKNIVRNDNYPQFRVVALQNESMYTKQSIKVLQQKKKTKKKIT